MRIAGLPPLPPRDKPAKRPESAGFDPAGEPARHVAAGSAVHPATSVEMLVALAAVDDAAERRRKLAAQAERGLEGLEALHRDLLAGNPTAERLEEIATWARDLGVPDDPEVAAILKEIELRALVELAKHGK